MQELKDALEMAEKNQGIKPITARQLVIYAVTFISVYLTIIFTLWFILPAEDHLLINRWSWSIADAGAIFAMIVSIWAYYQYERSSTSDNAKALSFIMNKFAKKLHEKVKSGELTEEKLDAAVDQLLEQALNGIGNAEKVFSWLDKNKDALDKFAAKIDKIDLDGMVGLMDKANDVAPILNAIKESNMSADDLAKFFKVLPKAIVKLEKFLEEEDGSLRERMNRSR